MGNEHPVFDAIRKRRSVRQFQGKPVSEEWVTKILESALWAPSGKNNQPWKFVVVQDTDVKGGLASLTHYGAILQRAPVCIAVFLDHSRVYDRTKDVQAIGACMQNMLLAIHALGLGGVWLGEILKNKERAGEVLGVNKDLELMGVVAFGHPLRKSGPGERAALGEKIVFVK